MARVMATRPPSGLRSAQRRATAENARRPRPRIRGQGRFGCRNHQMAGPQAMSITGRRPGRQRPCQPCCQGPRSRRPARWPGRVGPTVRPQEGQAADGDHAAVCQAIGHPPMAIVCLKGLNFLLMTGAIWGSAARLSVQGHGAGRQNDGGGSGRRGNPLGACWRAGPRNQDGKLCHVGGPHPAAHDLGRAESLAVHVSGHLGHRQGRSAGQDARAGRSLRAAACPPPTPRPR